MAANAGQFRHAQPPSKVVHFRNLPWGCLEAELIDLCKPFGNILNTKLNVGANHNQAFVEFVGAIFRSTRNSLLFLVLFGHTTSSFPPFS